MKSAQPAFKNLVFKFIFLYLLVGCSYEKTSLSLDSLFDPTWNFSESTELIFNENFVEVSGGKAQLKVVDLTDIGSDFNSGTFVGSSLNSNGGLSLNLNSNSEDSSVLSLVPGQASNLLGYWRFEQSWQDESSFAREGTPQGDATFSTANKKVGGSAASFDGTGGEVALSSGQFDFSNNQYSMAAWIYPTSAAVGFRTIIGIGPIDERMPLIAVRDGTGLHIAFGNGAGTGTQCALTVNDVVAINQWNHVAYTFQTGIGVKLYINGALAATPVTCLATNLLSHGEYRINDNGTFEGQIDELAIYNSILTAEEIRGLYEGQSSNFTELTPGWTPHWDNIVGYWKLDGNWKDSSSFLNHATPEVSATFSGSGKIGENAGRFLDGAGTNDKVIVPNSVSVEDVQEDSFSVAAWVYPTTTDASNTIFGKQGFHAGLHYDGVLKKYKFMLVDNSTNDIGCRSDITHEPNEYHHVVGVFDRAAGQTILYVNGVRVCFNQETPGITVREYGTASFYFGVEGVSEFRPFGGDIDEVALWSTNLSAADVSQIYHRQKQKHAAHYDSKVFDLGSANSRWSDLNWKTPLAFGKELPGGENGITSTEVLSEYANGDTFSGQDLEAYWNFDESSLNSAPDIGGGNTDFADSSSNNNHLEEAGGVQIGKEGIFQNALQFDGTDDHLVLPDFSPSPYWQGRNKTISIWFKPNTTSMSGIRSLFTSYALTYGFSRMRVYIENGILKYHFFTYPAPVEHINLNAGLVRVNDWNHVVITWDENEYKFFLNGVEADSQVNARVTSDNLFLATLGGNIDEGQYYAGLIDEVSVWNRSMTESNVKKMYRRGANRIKFQIKSCVDLACACKAYNLSPAGNASDCDGDSVANAVDTDDIYKAEFLGPGGSGATFYSELLNRKSTDFGFSCALNTSDENPNICLQDEITMAANPKASAPLIDYSDFPLVARPPLNPYFQYRAYFEADENLACDSKACLPELTSIQLNPLGGTNYYGSLQEIKPEKFIVYNSIQSAKIEADSCATFQLSPNGTDYYYWQGSSWVLSSGSTQRSSEEEVRDHIVDFSEQQGPGKLFVKAFLETNSSQTANCSISDIDINYTR